MKSIEDQSKKKKKPWPTKDAMDQIYDKKLWGGGNEFDFYSGAGSHDSEIVDPYLKVVIAFLKSFREPIKVCDLGCGDFNVGKEIVKHTNAYIAIDIVENLIRRNKEKFISNNLKFHCLDIVADDLPSADCVILRQVLQHLSNDEVEKVVDKLAKFKYIMLTEHIPEGEFVANKDIISGQGIRLKKQSGVNLLVAPFNLQVKEIKQLLSYTLEGKGEIVTTLYTVF